MFAILLLSSYFQNILLYLFIYLFIYFYVISDSDCVEWLNLFRIGYTSNLCQDKHLVILL